MRSPFVLIGLAGLAVVAGVVAIALLGSRDALDANPRSASAVPSPANSPTTSATSSPSVVPTDTASPAESSATPDATTGAAPSDGPLPPGSVVTLTADGLRLRSEPSISASVVATTAAGDAVYVEESIFAGPVRADGYDWYQVSHADGRDVWPWQDLAPDGLVRGWMAAESDAERFVELAEVTCPGEPVTLYALAFELTSWERLVCFGDAPFTVEGTYGCDVCGQATPGLTPPWLGDWKVLSGQYAYYPYIQVVTPPGAAKPENRDIVRATLRVDHPDAASCAMEPDPDPSSGVAEPDPRTVEMYCRQRVVLEAFDVIGWDDFGL